jgi:hypothetical protein
MPKVSCLGHFSLSLCFLFAIGVATAAFAQQTPYLTPGNLVVSVEGCGVNAGTCTSVPNGTGDGTGNSSASGYGDNQAAPLTLFQYAPNGAARATFVNSLVFPQTQSGANFPVSSEYGSASEGSLQLSGSGQYLTIIGYGVNANAFNANPSAYSAISNATLAQSGSLTGQSFTPVPRVVTTIDAYGNVNSSTANYNVFNGGHPRSTYSVDGINFYISGQGTTGDATGGVFLTTLGATNLAPTPITGNDAGSNASQDTRTVNSYDSGSGSQFYVSADSVAGVTNRDYIGTLGSPGSVPTSMANSGSGPAMLAGYGYPDGSGLSVLTVAQANGINAAGDYINLSPENYFFASPTVLYVADSGSPRNNSAGSQNPNSLCGAGGLQKWVLAGSTWTWVYTLYTGLNLVQNASCSSNTSGTTGLLGLTGMVAGDAVTLYATSYTIGDLDPSYLFGITDILSATTKAGTSFTQLAVAPPDSNFKGVSFAPTLPAGSATITSSLSGLAFSTSGTGCIPGTYTTPVTLIWTPGSSCVLSVVTPQSASGTQYNFNQWQDGTTATSDVVTAPSTSAIYTLSFSPAAITPLPAVVSLGNLTQTYSGSAEAATVSTAPAGLAITTIYTGIGPTSYGPSTAAPVNPGSYSVVATVVDPNYVGQQSGTLTISQADPALNLTLMSGMPASTPYGTTVYFTLATASVPQCPTGTAQLYVDGTVSGSPAVLSATSCAQPLQFQTATLAAGAHSIYAAYSGDPFFVLESSGTLSYTVTQDATTVTLGASSTSTNVGQPLTFTATITPASPDNAQPPTGSVIFYDGTIQIGTGSTLSATTPYTSIFSTSTLSVGSHSISATFLDTDGNFAGNSSPVAVETVNLIVPVINWTPIPAEFPYGTPMASTQLNAAAVDGNGNPVSGGFSYNFASGAVLNAGTVNLIATFTPSDPTTYAVNAATATLTVDPTALTVTPANLSMAYGANLPAFTYQITGFVNSDPSTVVTGAASCSTTATSTSPAGSYPINCSLGTLAASNYTFQFVSGTLTVTPATTAVIAWPTASAIIYGQKLASSNLTGGSASVAGTFAFTAPAAAPAAGTAVETVVFSPNDMTDYNALTGTVMVTVNKATPTVALTGAPATAAYGSTFALSATTNASTSASIAGNAPAGRSIAAPVCQIGGDSVFAGVGTDDNTGTTWPSTLICTGLGIPFTSVTNHALSGAGVNYISARLINFGVYTNSTTTTWDCCENNELAQGAAYESAALYETLAAAVHTATPDPAYDPNPTPAKQYAVNIRPAGPGCATSASTHFAKIATTVTGGSCTFTFNNVSGQNLFVIVEADIGSAINPAIAVDGAPYTGAWSSGSFVEAQSEIDGIGYAPFALPVSLSASGNNGSGQHTVAVTMTSGTLLEVIGSGQGQSSPAPSVYISGQYRWYDYNNPPEVVAGNQALSGAASAASQAGFNVFFNNPEGFIDGYASTTITWGAGCSTNPDTIINLSGGSVSTITLNPAGQKPVCTSAPSCKINGVGSGATCSTTYAAGTVTGITVGSGGSGYLPQQFNTQSGHPNGSTGATAIANSMLSATTANGACIVTGTTVTMTSGSGTCVLTASWPADANYLPASTTQSIVPAKAVPLINWPMPAAITYGTALSATQLDATAASNGMAVGGTFTYSSAVGTVLTAGAQTLSVSLSPSNNVDYTSATGSVTLKVNQAIPKITWTNPAAITYGTPLSATQLNATASVPGTFAYSPAIGTVLTAGTQPLTVTFTPTDATDFATITSTVNITVSKVSPTVSWTAPAPIYFGTQLSATQLNATASVPGTFVYSPAAGTAPAVGTPTLAVTFTPTDTTDYNTGKASVTLQVNQSTPVITWPAPAAIPYGTALSATQLDATATLNGATVLGTYTYTPARGVVLAPGTQTLSLSFAPWNTNGYTPTTASVALQVNQSTPVIAWPTPAAIPYGTALSAAQLNATATFNGAAVPGTFTYSPAAGTVLTAGTQTLSVSFAPSNGTQYASATVSVTLKVNQAIPKIAWSGPAAISYGTALSGTQLNATASVPGTFAYSPAAGTVLTAGTQTLSVSFTPTDSTDDATITGAVNISVSKAVPVVSWTAPAPINSGVPLGSAQLNATASIPGTFTYSAAAGTIPAAGTQTLSVAFTPTDTTDYSSANASVALQVIAPTPTISWPTPAAITYGTALSAAQLDATATFNSVAVPGTFTYAPAMGSVLTAGTQTLSVSFAPSNATQYTSATSSVTLNVSQASPAVAWVNPAAITYGTPLSGTQLNATASVPGTFAYSPAIGTALTVGTQTLTVTFTPIDATDYATVIGTAMINVAKASPTLNWMAPASIIYGTPLSSTQLDATASVPGTFAYSPSIGTVLTAGTQILSVTFTPTDATDYATVTGSATLTLSKVSPTVNWTAPAAISYGTPLSSMQLNATASVPGTFVYSPGLGTVLTAGTQALSVTFTPTDSSDYATVTGTAMITVGKAPPTLNWTAPAAITYGTPLSSAQLNATASVPGTFAYSPAAGTVPAGTQTLSVTFTPTDTVDYSGAQASVPLQVSSITPTITWPTPTAINYGTALSGAQLRATATVNGATVSGTFTYSPAAGTVLKGGAQTLTVSFAPSNAAQYTAATGSVMLTVNQVIPRITWINPAAITYGTPLSSTQLNATASVTGTFAYSPAIGTVLTAGTQPLKVTFTPADATDYATISSTVNLIVGKVSPTVSWTPPAPIFFGTPLSATQLNATASVPGTFVYSPAAGTTPAVGTPTLAVTFTPTDATDYNIGKASVTLQVNQSTPVITWPTPAAITYGAALSATQLNATATLNGATVLGTFTYTPARGVVLPPGTQTLSLSFAPWNTNGYTPTTASVTLQVTQSTAGH